MLKNIKAIIVVFVLVCAVFYIFMMLGHYAGKKKLETQYALAAPLIGEPGSWDSKEKELMAYLLLKCKTVNESGNPERMKSCWVGRAAAIQDEGKSTNTLKGLLDRQLKK